MERGGQRALTAQRVPVSGDAELNADVYLPKVEGRWPAVVAFGAYSTETHTAGIPTGTNEIGSPPVFTDRGYAPVIVERRGMGRSTGTAGVFFDPQDVDDHEAVIAWAAEQPWCNGDVVLFGTSYYGMTQPLVAARRPPALRAFFANEMCTDFYRHLVQFGGVPALYFLDVWMGANFTARRFAERMSPGRRALISHVTNGPLHPLVEAAVHKNVDRMFARFMSATPVESVREAYVNWLFDGKTRETSTIPEGSTGVLDRIEVPFTVVQNVGYFNLHQFGSYDLFENASTPADRRWLIIGPPMFDLPVYAWQGEALAFFDHVLRGTDNGYDEQPRVRYWVEGTDRFASSEAFPPREGEVTRLYLDSAGDDAAIHHLREEPATAGSNSWVAAPIGAPLLDGIQEQASQMLTYELVVRDATVLAGAVTANLVFSCNEIDSYVVARLSRVDADGARHHLSMGAIRPAARTVDASRSTAAEVAIDSDIRVPLVPGEPVRLRFSLTPAPTRLEPGETLRLDVASRTDLLRMSPGDGYAQFDLPVPPYLSRNTLHYGDSWIEVQMIPDRRTA
jgi:putative CocE/NonD family hydrolase